MDMGGPFLSALYLSTLRMLTLIPPPPSRQQMLYQMNGKAIASNRYSFTTSTPKRNSAQNVKMMSGIGAASTFIYKFSRPIAASGDSTVKALKQGPMDLIWAFSASPVTDENSPVVHDKYGTIKVNLFSDSAVSVSGGINTTTLYLVHGILMILAWSLLIPGGIFVARFTKQALGVWWFRLHWGSMLLGLFFTIVGFALAVSAKTTRHFTGVHNAMGLTVFIVAILQTVLGQWINVRFDPKRTEIPWSDRVHWYMGRLLYLAALVNVFLGIFAYKGTDNSSRVILFVVNGILVMLAIASVGYGSYRYGGQTHHTDVSKQRASQNSLSEFTPPSEKTPVDQGSMGRPAVNSQSMGRPIMSSPSMMPRFPMTSKSMGRPPMNHGSMVRPSRPAPSPPQQGSQQPGPLDPPTRPAAYSLNRPKVGYSLDRPGMRVY